MHFHSLSYLKSHMDHSRYRTTITLGFYLLVSNPAKMYQEELHCTSAKSIPIEFLARNKTLKHE